ncbi:unnamed protein product [Strongylus vulgaris]|uniref:aldehyde dehydrogenase (NAD(+)) n=1 Tax=Strongylus vulgaris TaxID=40348 RepID=A0A3P7LMH5_STRVU|nr:unnamed protein product [Strongylus vulgaris]
MAYAIDVALAIACIRYYAGYADKYHGKTIPIRGNFFTYTRHEAVGICGQIIPWNFPILMQAWKLGPALSMGNVVVMKPAEQTPLSALHVAALIKEVDLHVDEMDIPQMLTVSSSSKAQEDSTVRVHRASKGERSQLKKSENIKLDYAVKQAHEALFFNQGQVCCAGSRVFVEGKIYDDFIAKSKELAEKRVLGDPFDLKTEQGPQVKYFCSRGEKGVIR